MGDSIAQADHSRQHFDRLLDGWVFGGRLFQCLTNDLELSLYSGSRHLIGRIIIEAHPLCEAFNRFNRLDRIKEALSNRALHERT